MNPANHPIRILKILTLSFAIFAICVHHIGWISRCENLWIPGRTYDARTTQTCQLIWDHQTYQAKQYLKNH